jgi:hypothetical protein
VFAEYRDAPGAFRQASALKLTIVVFTNHSVQGALLAAGDNVIWIASG